MRTHASMILGALTAWLAGAAAAAQELPGDPDAGLIIATAECADCHVVGKDDDGAELPGAPSFQAVAGNPAMTALALRVFLRTPHSTMPNLILNDAETDDLIAYILSLGDGR